MEKKHVILFGSCAALSACMIVSGALMGGATAVFRKAAIICLQCIGIG